MFAVARSESRSGRASPVASARNRCWLTQKLKIMCRPSPVREVLVIVSRRDVRLAEQDGIAAQPLRRLAQLVQVLEVRRS